MNIIYLCDKKECGDICPNPECNHTTKIEHAVNLRAVTDENGKVLYYEEKSQIPCNVGDRFFILAYSDTKVVEVECTGIELSKREKIIWIENVNNRRDYWKLYFDDFETEHFKTKEEAEKALAEYY